MIADRWSRSRRLAAAVGSLGVACALALTGVGAEGVEQTAAAWQDTEVTQGTVQARWMEGFTRVTDPGWKMRGVRDTNLPNSIAMSGPPEATRNFAITYPQMPGTALATGADDARNSFGSGESPEIVPPRNTRDDLWMGRLTTGVAGDTEIARAGHCMSYPQPARISATTVTCHADPATPPRLVAHQNSVAYTFSIMASGLGSKRARVNVANFASTAQCFADGSSTASIDHTKGVLQLANEISSLNYSFSREESITDIIPTRDDPLERYDGTTDLWARYNVQISADDPSFVLAANVRKNTFRAPYYALAEMDLIIQVYSSGGASGDPGRFIDQINLPLTRSECGFSDGTRPLPGIAGTWRGDPNQLQWPGRSLGTTVPTNTRRLEKFTYSDLGSAPTVQGTGAAARAASLSAPSVSTSPSSPNRVDPSTVASTVTTTSASQHSASASSVTTKRQVTTIAAESPSISAGSPTSTPEGATPSEEPQVTFRPGRLSAAARIEEIGTVDVDGDGLLAVVKGDTVPTDARASLKALDAWVNEGAQPSGDWSVFTSPHPEEDGWRWAAANQATGTVAYIR